MTFYPDLSETTMITGGPHVRAVGWLDDKHDFPTGSVPDEFLRKLRRITENADNTLVALYDSEDDFLFNQFFGGHTCELCNNCTHGRNIGVPADQLLYVAPAMILHYVEEHKYVPPMQFIDAVLKAPIPETIDYQKAVDKFRELHNDHREREKRAYFEAASRRANEKRSPILDRILAEKKNK